MKKEESKENFPKERIIELFGEENIDKVNMFMLEHQSGFPSCQDNPDFWLTTTLSGDELRYVLICISYQLRKYSNDQCCGLSGNMKILKTILWECYNCAGYIHGILPVGVYVREAHIDVSMADYEAWNLRRNKQSFPIEPAFPKELTEKDFGKYFKKMI